MKKEFVIVELVKTYDLMSTSLRLDPVPDPCLFATKESAKERVKELPAKSNYVILPIYKK